jgi:hypothetical protein
MKAKLIFNLPEDNEDFEDAINARKYASMIFHLKNNLFRSLCKHSSKSKDYQKGVEDAINELLEYLE